MLIVDVWRRRKTWGSSESHGAVIAPLMFDAVIASIMYGDVIASIMFGVMIAPSMYGDVKAFIMFCDVIQYVNVLKHCTIDHFLYLERGAGGYKKHNKFICENNIQYNVVQ